MKKATLALLLTLTCATAWAADFDKGLAAYEAGDYRAALAEFRPLAERGAIGAYWYLGWMYDWGVGVTRNPKEAVKWYKLASEQGFARAQYQLVLMYVNGRGVLESNVYAHMWLNIAASKGVLTEDFPAATVKYNLSKMMTPQDISKAQDLARECVKKNYKDC